VPVEMHIALLSPFANTYLQS